MAHRTFTIVPVAFAMIWSLHSQAQENAPGNRRPAAALLGISACKNQTTAIPKDRIDVLKKRGLFPDYGDSINYFRDCKCGAANSQWNWMSWFASRIVKEGVPAETKMVVDLFDKIKGKVEAALDQFRRGTAWVNMCVESLAKYETKDSNGSFDPVRTTEKYLGEHPDNACAALWDGRHAKKPILEYVQEEVVTARVLLALGTNWAHPEIEQEFKVTVPVREGPFFSNVPKIQAALGDYEASRVDETMTQLRKDCRAELRPCSSPKALQEYALARYYRHMGENPILYQFNRAVGPKNPVTPSDLGSAYKRHQESMNKLMTVTLRDRDYFYFRPFLNDALLEMDQEHRGDYCEVAMAVLESAQALDRLNDVISKCALAAGGVGALLTRGILWRALALLSTGSYITDGQLAGQVLSQYFLLSKVEALCVQAHLRSQGLCDVETIMGRSNDLVTGGTSTALSLGLTAIGLGGPARRFAPKLFNQLVKTLGN